MNTTVDDFVAELIDSMLSSGAITMHDNRIRAAAEHTPVTAESPRMPLPAEWPE